MITLPIMISVANAMAAVPSNLAASVWKGLAPELRPGMYQYQGDLFAALWRGYAGVNESEKYEKAVQKLNGQSPQENLDMAARDLLLPNAAWLCTEHTSAHGLASAMGHVILHHGGSTSTLVGIDARMISRLLKHIGLAADPRPYHNLERVYYCNSCPPQIARCKTLIELVSHLSGCND